ncbi:uncharacterized protein LOC116178938 isoform X2 [Photinus pyralis]|uniref:uncharacterized protein LOC116178938 isoform X2 n=1 Tax=Photinus pyralis TaxID=7054 RepID=UPI00126762A6|nr:uncharacterized protein LOC116178938 isoform X2 [Photinus pyralis]
MYISSFPLRESGNDFNRVPITHFQMNGCVWSLCEVISGSTLNLGLNFTAVEDIGLNTQAIVSEALIIVGRPFPVYQTNLCDLTPCPILAGTNVVIFAPGFVQSSTPPGMYTVRVTIVDNAKTVICLEFTIVIKMIQCSSNSEL